MNAPNSTSLRTVTGVCPHDCPDSCGWVVTVDETPTGPVPVQLRGNPEHPYSLGELCPKVNRFLERHMSSDRVLRPLRRVGAKGPGATFEPISWDEALAQIAQRWTEIRSQSGGRAIVPFFSAGNQSELAMGFGSRFVDAMGMSHIEGNVCGATAGAGTALTYGNGYADDPRELSHAKTVILWGTNTRLTNRHLWASVEAAKASGATIVVVDPIRTMTAESADIVVQIVPGTDIALVLAIAHILVRDGLIDQEYIRAHTVGFEEFRAHVEQWTPERAALVCRIGVDEIEQLAALYGRNRPSFIRTLIGAEHTAQGAGAFRALAMLPLMTGAWNERGGGFARSVGSWTGSALANLSRPRLRGDQPRRALQQNHIGRWLTDETLEPPVRSLLVCGANPVVSIPNSERIRRGLARADLFTVVHEQFLTDTALYADFVLPAATQLEADDVMVSWGSPHLTYNHAATPPRGEAVSNPELFRRLARAMGFADSSLLADDETVLGELFSGPRSLLPSLSLAQLREQGTVEVPIGPRRYEHGGFATPDGRARFVSEQCEALGLGRVPDWVPPTSVDARHPLVLATPKTHTRFLNSSYAHLPGHGDREGGPFVELCADDAAALGVGSGDRVEVFNDRATLVLDVKVSKRLRPGLVAVPYGWWARSHEGGLVANALTDDTIVDHGGGVAYNDTRVGLRPHAH